MYTTEKRYRDPESLGQPCLNPANHVATRFALGYGWIPGGPPDNAFTTQLPPNSRSCLNEKGTSRAVFTPSSHHGDWLHVTYGDGSVVSVANSIDQKVWEPSGHLSQASHLARQ